MTNKERIPGKAEILSFRKRRLNFLPVQILYSGVILSKYLTMVFNAFDGIMFNGITLAPLIKSKRHIRAIFSKNLMCMCFYFEAVIILGSLKMPFSVFASN